MLLIALLTNPSAAAPPSGEAADPDPSLLVLRVHTDPGPLKSGASGTVTIEGKGFLYSPLTFVITDPSVTAPTITVDTVTISSDNMATLGVTVPPNSRGRHVLSLRDQSGSFRGGASLWVDSSAGTFHAVQPERVLDTRVGTGFSRPLAPSETISLPVTGRGEIPSTGVSAIVANLTAVVPSAAGYLTIWPSGVAQPTVSNVNFSAGEVVPNQVTVGVGSDGRVQLFNSGATTDVLLDVVGWFATETAPLGSTYQKSVRDRILDTRATVPIAPRSTLRVPIYPGDPANGFGIPSAVAANLTVTHPSQGGFLTVYPAGATRPNTSTHNFRAGQTTANMVTVRLGTDHAIDVYNGSDGPLDLIVDLRATFMFDEPFPYRFEAATAPFRALDTRLPPIGQRLAPSQAAGVPLQGPKGVPTYASYVVGNVTATGADGSGYMNLHHGMDDPARLSSINYVNDQTVANQFHSGLGVFGYLTVSNFTSNAHAIVDVFGWFGL